MALSTTSGEQITLAEAQQFARSFRIKFPNDIKGSFIGADNLKLILDQQGCIGIRCYNGYDDANARMNLILVGVDDRENDMTNGIIMERLLPCPRYCNSTSPLFNV